MKPLLIAFVTLSSSAFANPVASAIVEKTWERCVISAGYDFSTVSCAVGYEGKLFLKEPFYVFVPVILPAILDGDTAKAVEAVKARLEIGGKVYESKSIKFTKDTLLPDGTVKAESVFVIKSVPSKSFAMVVSYRQPTIRGSIYYLPQFEEGKDPKNLSEFSVTVFPADGNDLKLESRHKEKATIFATRITVKPVHNEIIAIAIKKSEQGGADQPTTARELNSEGKDKPQPESKVAPR